MKEQLSLQDLEIGESLQVISVGGEDTMARRLEDLGVVEGTRIVCLGASPLGDPRAYLIRGAVIALRASDAKTVVGVEDA